MYINIYTHAIIYTARIHKLLQSYTYAEIYEYVCLTCIYPFTCVSGELPTCVILTVEQNCPKGIT